MGKGKRLIIAAAILVLLVGGYLAATNLIKDDEGDTGETTESAVSVSGIAKDSVIGITYVYGDETIELVKENEKWYLSADRNFPINQSYPETMLSATAELTASRLISENKDDFEQYGLAEPMAAYIFTNSDKTQTVYYIGSHNTFSGAYYLNVGGTTQIYLIDEAFIENFMYGESELANVEELPHFSYDEISKASVKIGKSTLAFEYYEDGIDTMYSDMYKWFTADMMPLDSTFTEEYLTNVTNISSTGCADYKADSEELKKFGFSEPQAVISLTYHTEEEQETGELDDDGNEITETIEKDGSFTLTIGGYADDGASLYAKASDSDTVYKIDGEYLNKLEEYSIDDLRTNDVCLVELDSIESVDVTIDGKTSTVKIETKTDDKGTESKTFSLDKSIITASDFNDFYTAIQSMQAESSTDTPVDGKAYITVVYHRNTEKFSTMKLEFVPYDANFYLVRFNGEERLLVNKRDVESVATAFSAIKKH